MITKQQNYNPENIQGMTIISYPQGFSYGQERLEISNQRD
jgi:hypothetical protein